MTLTLGQLTSLSTKVAFLSKHQLTFVVIFTCNPISWEVEAGGSEFKDNLVYIKFEANLRYIRLSHMHLFIRIKIPTGRLEWCFSFLVNSLK